MADDMNNVPENTESVDEQQQETTNEETAAPESVEPEAAPETAPEEGAPPWFQSFQTTVTERLDNIESNSAYSVPPVAQNYGNAGAPNGTPPLHNQQQNPNATIDAVMQDYENRKTAQNKQQEIQTEINGCKTKYNDFDKVLSTHAHEIHMDLQNYALMRAGGVEDLYKVIKAGKLPELLKSSNPRSQIRAFDEMTFGELKSPSISVISKAPEPIKPTNGTGVSLGQKTLAGDGMTIQERKLALQKMRRR